MPQTLSSLRSRYERPVRYVFAGGAAACIDIGILYFLASILRVWYVLAVAVAFLFGFAASFTFQKFWTFRDGSTEQIHRQAAFYFGVSAVSFFLNIALIYALVEWLHVWYILAKVLVSGLIAFGSFFIYQAFIFAQAPAKNLEQNHAE